MRVRHLYILLLLSVTLLLGACVSFPPLINAARNGSATQVRQYLDSGWNINERDQYTSATALHWAVYSGDMETVRILLEAGADINSKNQDGRTPLHWAIAAENREITRYLLRQGASTDFSYRPYYAESFPQWPPAWVEEDMASVGLELKYQQVQMAEQQAQEAEATR